MPVTTPELSADRIGGGIDATLVDGVSSAIKELYRGCVPALDHAAYSPIAKIPCKVAVYLQAVRHRLCDLSRSYVSEVNQGAFAASFLIARSLLEGACLASDLVARIEAELQAQSPGSLATLDTHIEKLMHGAKARSWLEYEDPVESINIVTVLQRVAKHLSPDVLSVFEDLSEFAHFNAASTLASYHELSKHGRLSTFSDNPAPSSSSAVAWHLTGAHLSLLIFLWSSSTYDSLSGRFISLCEAALYRAGTWPNGVPYPRQQAKP